MVTIPVTWVTSSEEIVALHGFSSLTQDFESCYILAQTYPVNCALSWWNYALIQRPQIQEKAPSLALDFFDPFPEIALARPAGKQP